MYRIISIDLDGTLLSSKNKITKYTKEVIRFLASKKIFFILASGRHYIDIIEIRDILKIKSFIIASNGAEVYNLDDKLIFNDNLDEDISKKMCRMKYLDKDIITQIFRDNKWYVNNNDVNNKFCSALSILKHNFFHPDDFQFNNISKVFFTSKNLSKLYSLEKKIIHYWGNKINVSFSVPGCLEVISGKTSKGYGLKLISNLLGIPLNDFVSFGDGMNDYDMLSISGKSYVMKNADVHLKKLLPFSKIIESNNNDGVARCLSDLLIKKNLF